MSSAEGAASDAEILNQIRQLATGISDERTAKSYKHNRALELNPQPIPLRVLRSLLEAVALNPQPLPPSSVDGTETGNR